MFLRADWKIKAMMIFFMNILSSKKTREETFTQSGFLFGTEWQISDRAVARRIHVLPLTQPMTETQP